MWLNFSWMYSCEVDGVVISGADVGIFGQEVPVGFDFVFLRLQGSVVNNALSPVGDGVA